MVQKTVTEFRPELELSHVPKPMCSESRALQLPFLILVGFCEQTSKSRLRWIKCQGSDPPDTDLKSIVGFCE